MNDLVNPGGRIKCLAGQNKRDCRITFLYDQQKGKCHYCDQDMLLHAQYAGKRAFATIDHIIPRIQGGTRSNENTVAACARCNTMKGAMPYAEFMHMRKEHLKGNNSKISSKERRKRANPHHHPNPMQKEIEAALERQNHDPQREERPCGLQESSESIHPIRLPLVPYSP